MKKCPNCGKEMDENAIFCSQCGREFVKEKKKLSLFERKQAKERERQELMAKSYLTKEQVDSAPFWDKGSIVLEKKGTIKDAKTMAVVRIVISVILFVAAVVWGEISSKGSLNANLKLLVIFAVFFICAIAIMIFINDIHLLTTLNKMSQSQMAIKKIKYGQAPYVYKDGDLYLMLVKSKCAKCESDTHIEEVDGSFVVVCNQDRTHIFKIDTVEVMKECFADKKEGSGSEEL